MAIDTISPVASSVLLAGDSISFTIDDTYTSLVIEVQVAGGGYETAYSSGSVAGYTVTIVSSGGRDTFTVTSDSGWSIEPLVIRVTEDESGSTVVTSTSWYLGTNRVFPQDSQPLNPIYVGTLLITEDNVQVRDDAGWLDFDAATFNVTDMGSGKVHIEGVASGTGDVVGPASVTDNAVALFDTATGKLIKEVAALGASGTVLTSTGVSTPPTFQASVAGSTLDGVINAGAPDNDSDVPIANPIIFRSGGADFTPLTVAGTGVGAGTALLQLSHNNSAGLGIEITETVANDKLKLYPNEIIFESTAGSWVIGDDGNGTRASQTLALYPGYKSTTGTAGTLSLNGGVGTSGATDGIITFGNCSEVRIVDTNGLSIAEGADHPVTPVAGYGQVWIKSDTPNTLWFTDDAGTDAQLGVDTTGDISLGIRSHGNSTIGITGSGTFDTDSAVYSSVTSIRINILNDMSGLFDNVATTGSLILRDQADPTTNWVTYTVASITDVPSYGKTFAVSYKVGAGSHFGASQNYGIEYLADAATETSIPLTGATSTQSELNAGWDGTLLESARVVISESGGTVSLALDASGGGDLRCRFGAETFDYDTTPATTIALTAGTDTVPVMNFVWLTETAGTIALAAGTDWPSTPYCAVATVLVQSAADVALSGPYKVHAWTDHTASTYQGHIADLSKWVRAQPATWQTGVGANAITVSAPDAYLSTDLGTVLQLHDHDFPAFDMSTGDPLYVVNEPGTAYNKITSLDSINTDSASGSINGKWVNLVIWGSVNEASGDCKLFCNLPSGSYNSQVNAEADGSGYSNYAIPADFTGTGFLIANYVVQAYTSGTWVHGSITDLRGLFPNTSPSAGGGGGVSDHGALSGLADDDHTQYVLGDGTREQDGALFTERADHVNTPTAGFGEIWVNNTAPCEPMFTDDAGTDHNLKPVETVIQGGSTNGANVTDWLGPLPTDYYSAVKGTSWGVHSGAPVLTVANGARIPAAVGIDGYIESVNMTYQVTNATLAGTFHLYKFVMTDGSTTVTATDLGTIATIVAGGSIVNARIETTTPGVTATVGAGDCLVVLYKGTGSVSSNYFWTAAVKVRAI